MFLLAARLVSNGVMHGPVGLLCAVEYRATRRCTVSLPVCNLYRWPSQKKFSPVDMDVTFVILVLVYCCMQMIYYEYF